MDPQSVKIFLVDVFYDVRNNSFVTGNSRQNGTNFELVANMQASDDTESANKICRAIQKAMGDIVTELSEYKPAWNKLVSIDGSTLNLNFSTLQGIAQTFYEEESYKDDEVYSILTFSRLPSNFNTKVLPSIAQNVHAYLYEKAMMDWFLATNKDDAADFNTLAEQSVQTIRKAINTRVKPTRS